MPSVSTDSGLSTEMSVPPSHDSTLIGERLAALTELLRNAAHQHQNVAEQRTGVEGSLVDRALVDGARFTDSELTSAEWVRTFRRITRAFGAQSLDAFADAWRNGRLSSHAAAEALSEIGRLDDFASMQRRRILLRALRSADASVRDGAASGLAALRDPSVVEIVKVAIENEPHDVLRQFLREIADDLRKD